MFLRIHIILDVCGLIRDWIYVEDHCRAIEAVIEKGMPGQVYNVGASSEKTNLQIIRFILQEMNMPESYITFVADRPGHDKRYAMDATKLGTELGWRPVYNFEEAMKQTVRWYIKNDLWWRRVKGGEYRRNLALVR